MAKVTKPKAVTWLSEEMWRVMQMDDRALHTASSQKGQREIGKNGGPFVEKVLRSVGLGRGYAWCAAFVYWCYTRAGAKPHHLPNKWKAAAVRHWVAWAEEQHRLRGANEKPLRGDLFFWLNANGTGHIGLVAEVGVNKYDDMQLYRTIEGNTNAKGSREGDGVYEKYRTREFLQSRHRFGFIDMNGV